MNKTKINYWVDLIIALAFVVSAVSGIVFLLPISGSTALGVSYQVWDQIHTWGSLLMITGVLACPATVSRSHGKIACSTVP